MNVLPKPFSSLMNALNQTTAKCEFFISFRKTGMIAEKVPGINRNMKTYLALTRDTIMEMVKLVHREVLY